MIKRMLIDGTQPEETRVVVINGNKLEDVEFETTNRKQIKGNIYIGKVMRVEPSLQACFVDYGGNKHGFLAFGEIHPDYYNVSQEEIEETEKEAEEIIEAKRQIIKEREAERERLRAERHAAYEARLQAEQEALAAQKAEAAETETAAEEAPSAESIEEALSAEPIEEASSESAAAIPGETAGEEKISETDEESKEEAKDDKPKKTKRRVYKKRIKKLLEEEQAKEELKVSSAETDFEEETISEEAAETVTENADEDFVPEEDEDDYSEQNYEMQKKLLKLRKLFHRHKIQDVIKEGQTLIVQVVKEERGNKGAALTTYLSLAGRYCVLMPNRIKSGGVSRKITNASDRNRLKDIVKELPLTTDMSIIVRTAGEEKSKPDIVRDYNYLIRSWNLIRNAALTSKIPSLIHEEGDLIKRALRDIYTKDISEVLVAGESGYAAAREFVKILSPHNLKKIKLYRNHDIPLFQRFQVETQLDKLHEANAQLESGGYLVINPTEALVSIDVNSGRATKEKDLEETALKTNLEACDEIARQLRLRNLAGLVVVDFIDMDEPANNHAVEKRMKEAMKKDRSRVQIAKMSCFGLLELSRQRLHSSFFESNYQVCPHCHGKGLVRNTESSAVFILREIEEEGIKGRSSKLNVFIPGDVAIYLLNQKRQMLINLEQKYKMSVFITADDTIKNISDYRFERIKAVKQAQQEVESAQEIIDTIEKQEAPLPKEAETAEMPSEQSKEDKKENPRRQSRDNRRGGRRRDRFDRRGKKESSKGDNNASGKENVSSFEPVILYNSHEDIKSPEPAAAPVEEPKEKSTWWKKLIKG